ncbi:hypothetical protein PF008_g222 [Phytophthora fragariae]|uniref:Uncharacterized protein n=1 Tax=Phytophthora fragariae TaxID=53985 RepID=A0A6G0SPE4_9STRA|nr:hypothetical protein PF008_g222 [Phytophthora fragariae]
MRVSAVTLLLGNEARELLLYAGLSLPELLRCVASIFPALQRSGNAATSVALCHASTGVFYPLSLLRRSPELFEHAPYYLVLYGEEGGADDVDTSLGGSRWSWQQTLRLLLPSRAWSRTRRSAVDSVTGSKTKEPKPPGADSDARKQRLLVAGVDSARTPRNPWWTCRGGGACNPRRCRPG